MRLRFLLLTAAMALPMRMLADTQYSYTGNNFTTINPAINGVDFYTTSDSVTGEFTVGSPLPANFNGTVMPESFSFTDGVNTDTEQTYYFNSYSFDITTDASGNIVSWTIDLDVVDPLGIYIETTTNGDTGSDFLAGSGSNTSGGVWTEAQVAGTPEPGSLALLGTGLLGIGGALRRRIWR